MSTTYVKNESSVARPTLTEILVEAVDRFGDANAFGRITADLSIEWISYAEFFARIRVVSGALEERGLVRGDRAAILSQNRLEWALADYGCLCLGVTVVPIYPTLTAEQVAKLLADSEAKVIFVPDEEQLEKLLEARGICGSDVRIVVFDPPTDLPDCAMSWADFMESGRSRAAATTEDAFRARALQAKPDDVATMLYTSGTTGEPKGVMLTHGNVGSNVEAGLDALKVTDTDVTVSFLPLSHIFQRMVDYLFVRAGCAIVHARTMLTAVEDMRIAHPTVVVAVPRVYEKVHAAVMEVGGIKRLVVDWAVDIADRMAAVRLRGATPSGFLSLQFALADRLVFRKVQDAVGGRMRFFVSGSAPLSADLNRFFYSIGLPILEGYGLTETSPVTNVNTFEDFRIGTVGKAVAGTEIEIAEDGEILIRGPQVMKGYYGKPEATAEAIDADGWFHTGDIGELDDDGFLKITDRKKDLIVTAGGKNVAPQPVENRLKGSPLIEQAVMIGDRRKFPSVLIVPAFGALRTWAGSQGLSWEGNAALIALPEVQAHLEREVESLLHGFASYETPKKVALLPEDFTIADGSLTPTLKVKRRVVEARFSDLIDGLYESADRPR